MPDLSNKLQGSFISIDQLIRLNFFLLIFLTFFGVRIPFQEYDYAASYEAESSNIPNQVLYLFLFISSLVTLINRFDKTLSFIRTERYLSLFILLCLVSALWSAYPFLSIKRSFQLLVMFIVVIEALLNIEPNILLKQLKIVISLYLFFNLFSCLFISNAIDPTFGTWRGIELQKNAFGQVSFYCFLSSVVLFTFERTKLANYYNLALLLLSVFLIYKARSSTVWIVLFIIIFLGFLFKIETIFNELKIGRSFFLLISLFGLSLIVIFINFSSEVFNLVPEYFGKDSTLSMRVPIWEYLWSEVEKNFFLGNGYATYWIMGDSRIDVFASYFEGFRVNQAHNGYLEIMLQLGVVGFFIFLFPIIAFIYRMLKLKSNIALLVLLSIMMLNFTESVLFQRAGLTTLFFLVSYISTSVFHFNLRKINHDEEIHS